MKRWIVRYKFYLIGTALALGVWYWLLLPRVLFHDSYCTVLEDRTGKLLGATIASDGQWRFPEGQRVPAKFKEALVLFEDKRFYYHPGVDLLAMARAFRQNIRAGKITSGGSTLSMQVIRLSRKNQSRTILEKIYECILATRLELRYSKEEILALYAAHAPFGGNVVGMEAACWRYFGRSVEELSWAEAALLAVLPNNPSLIHPGKNRKVLQAKRDRLLARLLVDGKMDSLTYQLSLSENIPDEPVALPRITPHLLSRAAKDGFAQTRVRTSIDVNLQERVNQLVFEHHGRLKGNQVFNAAALIMEVNSGRVLAYVGNVPSGREHGEQVDIIEARRSTGSILKPFLFAAMLDEGKILPHTLLPDIPTTINGFSPRNFSKEHDGAVPASQALIRSLNIPAVYELREYRYEKFYELLKRVGLTTLSQPSDHYGLSLILGGAEGTLWDITGAYASMGRTLNQYFQVPGSKRYDKNNFHAPLYVWGDSIAHGEPEENSWLSAASIYTTMDVLKEVYRPGEETGWRYFNSAKKIAWKTGTSHGLRDGWAVGLNADYAVGVWVGNADGEGRPGLTGTEAASPILFEIFSQLPGNTWFSTPTSELKETDVCAQSGMRATEWCGTPLKISIPLAGLQSAACRFHKQVHLSEDSKYRVHGNCEPIDKMKFVSWFVLPPVQEYYYRTKHLSYRSLPPFRSDCENPAAVVSMELMYPKPNAAILVPRELDGRTGQVLFEAVHRNRTSPIYWHLDGDYMGTTQSTHRLAMAPEPGAHVLTIIDELGDLIRVQFTILDSTKP